MREQRAQSATFRWRLAQQAMAARVRALQEERVGGRRRGRSPPRASPPSSSASSRVVDLVGERPRVGGGEQVLYQEDGDGVLTILDD